MRKRVYVFTILLLILSTNVAFGDGNKTKLTKVIHKGKDSERIKRSSTYDDDSNQFWANRGKRQASYKDLIKNDLGMEENRKFLILDNKMKNDPPFWGNRGRRSSEETADSPYADIFSANNDYYNFRTAQKLSDYPNLKDRREDTAPFWGARGRRNSEEILDDNDIAGPFWSSRGRRQDEDPFWGSRGRRESDQPFWGNRGRRDDDPFWGARGRREEDEPFWGNRGRRHDEDPFWGNRGKKDDDTSELFWGNRGRRKEDLKESIIEAISKVESDINSLSRLKKSNGGDESRPFWTNRGRDSQLKHLFDGSRIKSSNTFVPFKSAFELNAAPSVSSTIMDDRIYADEPHYILVDRSSRASAELDPFFISRGKKKNWLKTARGRRGAIEEIVKSVRNDPYYIARGKKDISDNPVVNSTHEELLKAKELICATIKLMQMKNENTNVKREINENDRDRRNILKKLAAQLQNDPYFVSRGKKNEIDENGIEEFVSQVTAMCH
ncbi:hypothetical protein MSG28_011981 [Choristoneura fumiferana]|uniref:Uncharacterized protein n=1 Tax=Choristoneura fumiferana TaxID=7141 RepID=A0ACC0KNM5_CHOFU|nr:hypothetical protein MSG28_011981 [Choristoneura fumiferana]